MPLTREQLFERLFEVYGVENINQLAPKMNVDSRQLYRWVKGGMNFEEAVQLLELAGYLRDSVPEPDAGLLARVDREREAVQQRLEALQDLRAELARRLGTGRAPE